MQQTIQERLRNACNDIRRKSYPISDLIPLLQEAADELDKQQEAYQDLYDTAWDEGKW